MGHENAPAAGRAEAAFASGQAITFLVPGQRVDAHALNAGAPWPAASAASAAARGRRGPARGPSKADTPIDASAPQGARVKAAVQVGAQRSAGAPQRLQAVVGEDVVRLTLINGPQLILHPETAYDLMRAQQRVETTSRAARGATARSAPPPVPDEVAVPAQLRWVGLEQAAPTRGFIGDVLIKTFEILTGLAKDTAVTWAASAVVKAVDGQVQEGVYQLTRAQPTAFKLAGVQPLAQVPAPKMQGQPLLVLIHGTFVDTSRTFAKLWRQHPQRVDALFDRYGDRVYALDHPTMGSSPISNALALAKALPEGAVLHLLTHSRGGLVAEVLARVAHQPGVTAADLQYFEGEGREKEIADLTALARLLSERRVTVARVVRVACPARGTLLASRRLDAYLSVLRWTLQLAEIPVLPQLVDFLGEVARRRANPAELPGLEAMMPGSPLVRWLNAAPSAIAGDLRVIAGDLQGDSLGSWVKTLATDAFYWTDHDMVVQTSSMYGGAPRAGGAHFLLDQGGKVTHFNYFGNERTAHAAQQALTEADTPPEFALIGPLSWAGQSADGTRGARGALGGRAKNRSKAGAARGAADKAPGTRDPQRPAVFVLPGILGSHLSKGDERVWFEWLRLVGGLEDLVYQANGADGLHADAPIEAYYGDLMEHLAHSHEVVPFAFDWRRPMEEEAQRLGHAVQAALSARAASNQPVRLLAHSMGGLVARLMQIQSPKVWDAMLARPTARVLMLGTPNGGSWAPMQVLSGDDTMGNFLAAVGAPFANQRGRQIIAEMPGLLQLQAGLLDPALGLAQSSTWRRIADADYQRLQERNWWHRFGGEAMESAYLWGVPPQAVLDRAVQLRMRLDEQREQALPAFADRLLMVVGSARLTPAGIEGLDGLDDKPDFSYLNAVNAGDGRVTLESALLPGVRTWQLECEHSGLPNHSSSFPAYVELLETGSTTRLETLRAAQMPRGRGPRGAAAGSAAGTPALVRSRPSREGGTPQPLSEERELFSPPPRGAAAGLARREQALAVRVLNGNLAYISQPLLLGHYRGIKLTGTEAVVNALIGDGMGLALKAGLYPEAVGSQQIFTNARTLGAKPFGGARPQAAIVVGLGDEGELDERALEQTVRQGVMAWSQRVLESTAGAPASIELTATLAGSGGFGISAGASALAIVNGVQAANAALAEVKWPQVSQLTLIELFLDRANEAWRLLNHVQRSQPGLCRVEAAIATGTGARRRQEAGGYRGVGYELLRIAGVGQGGIEFAFGGRRARTEVYAERTQDSVVRELVGRAARLGAADAELGRTLFQLLVPVDLESQLAGNRPVVLDLDRQTAPIPWELLEAAGDDGDGMGRMARGRALPWAIRCKLLRKLRTNLFRTHVQDALITDHVLVIGEPEVPPGWSPLPGALREAQEVAATFAGNEFVGPDRVVALGGGADAGEVITAVLARRYRVLHISGHGQAMEDETGKPQEGGVVLSGGVFLGEAIFKKMRIVPELVFVNCCHLAGRHNSHVLQNRGAFAATVAEQLIDMGVRCVVAAGWEVGDEAALEFARAFYAALLQHKPFIEAVAEARKAAWKADPEGNTWGAYQCYGDPNWTLRLATEDGNAPAPAGSADDDIGSPVTLARVLEDLAAEHDSPLPGQDAERRKKDGEARLARVRALEGKFGQGAEHIGAVGEAFALVLKTLGRRADAIEWYGKAVTANDATASLKAAEHLYNLRVREAWDRAKHSAPTTPAFADARKDLIAARDHLRELALAQATQERWSLVGSADKRLHRLELRAKRAQAARDALEEAVLDYTRAEAIAHAQGDPVAFYPACNRMALDLVAHGGTRQWAGLDQTLMRAAVNSLEALHAREPDFWTATARIELRVYQAVSDGRLDESLQSVREDYEDVRRREPAIEKWDSVAEQAEFVLERYGERVKGKEKAAAQDLGQSLRRYAQLA
jgi:hypothetical protein